MVYKPFGSTLSTKKNDDNKLKKNTINLIWLGIEYV